MAEKCLAVSAHTHLSFILASATRGSEGRCLPDHRYLAPGVEQVPFGHKQLLMGMTRQPPTWQHFYLGCEVAQNEPAACSS